MKRLMALALAAALVGCASLENIESEEAGGTGLGAIVGGVIGYQFGGGLGQALATTAGVIGGAVAGLFAGDAVADMDPEKADEGLIE